MSGEGNQGTEPGPDAPGQGPGVQPVPGRGAAPGETGAEGGPEDPAARSGIPGFGDHADPVEEAVEGAGVAEGRNAAEDLPRQG